MSNGKSPAAGIAAVVSLTLLVFGVLLAVYLYNDAFHGIFVNNPRSVESIMGEVAENSAQSAAVASERKR